MFVVLIGCFFGFWAAIVADAIGFKDNPLLGAGLVESCVVIAVLVDIYLVRRRRE